MYQPEIKRAMYQADIELDQPIIDVPMTDTPSAEGSRGASIAPLVKRASLVEAAELYDCLLSASPRQVKTFVNTIVQIVPAESVVSIIRANKRSRIDSPLSPWQNAFGVISNLLSLVFEFLDDECRLVGTECTCKRWRQIGLNGGGWRHWTISARLSAKLNDERIQNVMRHGRLDHTKTLNVGQYVGQTFDWMSNLTSVRELCWDLYPFISKLFAVPLPLAHLPPRLTKLSLATVCDDLGSHDDDVGDEETMLKSFVLSLGLCDTLVDLRLHATVSDAQLVRLRSFEKLQHVSFEGCYAAFTGSGLEHLPCTIESLDLWNSGFKLRNLEQLDRFTMLQRLRISLVSCMDNDKSDDEKGDDEKADDDEETYKGRLYMDADVIAKFTRIPCIQTGRLAFLRAELMDPVDEKQLGMFKSIPELELLLRDVSDATIASVSAILCDNLTELHLFHSWTGIKDSVTNFGLQALHNATRLRHLQLTSLEHVSDEGIRSLVLVKSLERLDIAACSDIYGMLFEDALYIYFAWPLALGLSRNTKIFTCLCGIRQYKNTIHLRVCVVCAGDGFFNVPQLREIIFQPDVTRRAKFYLTSFLSTLVLSSRLRLLQVVWPNPKSLEELQRRFVEARSVVRLLVLDRKHAR